jgi:hypothetical protein
MAEFAEATEARITRTGVEPTPRKRENVHDALSELHQCIDSLASSVGNLFDALDVVTRREDVDPAGLKVVEESGISTTQETIRKAIESVNSLTVRVDARRYRLDI